MTRAEQIEVIKSFGLEVEEVASGAFRVINDSKRINIDDLQVQLGRCTLLVPKDIIRSGKSDSCNVYYIVVSFENNLVGNCREDLIQSGITNITTSYYNSKMYEPCIDTLYTYEELEAHKQII